MGCGVSTKTKELALESGPYINGEDVGTKKNRGDALKIKKQVSYDGKTIEMMAPEILIPLEMQKHLYKGVEDNIDCFYCSGKGEIPHAVDLNTIGEMDNLPPAINGAIIMKLESSRQEKKLEFINKLKSYRDLPINSDATATPFEDIKADIKAISFEDIKPIIEIRSISCWVCKGTGKTSKWLSKLEISPEDGINEEAFPDCLVCYDKGQYGMSIKCNHFFCGDCIQGTLEAVMDIGDFPAFCPACKIAAMELKDKPDTGLIEEKAVSFLVDKGVITKEFFFRFMKQQNNDDEIVFPCPGGCGNFLIQSEPKFEIVQYEARLKIKFCPSCGVNVCDQCHKVISKSDMKSHLCPALKKAVEDMGDQRTMELLKTAGKQCPNCNMIVMKNEGCDVMMCGTNAHGKLSVAIKNGGCGHGFSWSTLKPVNTHYINLDGKQVNGNPTTDYPDGIPGYKGIKK